jgi:hypothetical protein
MGMYKFGSTSSEYYYVIDFLMLDSGKVKLADGERYHISMCLISCLLDIRKNSIYQNTYAMIYSHLSYLINYNAYSNCDMDYIHI